MRAIEPSASSGTSHSHISPVDTPKASFGCLPAMRGSIGTIHRRHTCQTLALPFPLPQETAAQKVRAAEDGWNSRNPERLSLAYTIDSVWRNLGEFF